MMVKMRWEDDFPIKVELEYGAPKVEVEARGEFTARLDIAQKLNKFDKRFVFVNEAFDEVEVGKKKNDLKKKEKKEKEKKEKEKKEKEKENENGEEKIEEMSSNDEVDTEADKEDKEDKKSK